MSEIDKKPVEEGEEEDNFTPDDNTDWKARAEELAQKRREDGIRHRERTKSLKEQVSSLEAKPQSKKEGLGYGEKAYLKSSGFQTDEFQLVLDAAQNTGKTIDEVAESKWFQAILKEHREEKAVKDAIPQGSSRSNSSARDTVEYWVAKGELPPRDEVELRRKVVNAKIKKERSRNKFADIPLII